MRAYIIRRLLISIPLVFLMTFLVFAVINLNPEASIQRYVMQPNVSFQFIEQEKERLGLYDPLPLRYLRWLGGVLGDIRFGRETRSLVSFADAGALRSTFGLSSSWTIAGEAVRLSQADEEVDIVPRMGGPDAVWRWGAFLNAITGQIVNTSDETAHVVMTVDARERPIGYEDSGSGAGEELRKARWDETIVVAPGGAAPFSLRSSDMARNNFRMAHLVSLTLRIESGGPVTIQSVSASSGFDVLRPVQRRPYAVLEFMGGGHSYSFARLGSPYTRLVLPRSDWKPAGKAIAVEEVGGEPVDVIETRRFRSLRLDVGNPLDRTQTFDLVIVSGPPGNRSETDFEFSVGPRRRETTEFMLDEMEQEGVDLEEVHGLAIRAQEPGILYVSRTVLVLDERPVSVGFTPNFGVSYENNIPVLRRLGSRVKNTILLVIASMLLTWIVALPFGVIAAVRQYKVSDKLLSFLSFIGMALPGFFLAILVRYAATLAADPDSIISFLPDLPTSGRISAGHDELPALGKVVDILRHSILPILVLGMGGMAGMQRVMRGTMLETQRQQFIVTARAKGLTERAVIYKHALRNAITPFVAGFGSILPALIGGSALIEIVFNYPGVGQLMLPAVLNRDINLVMGNTLIAALLLVLGNLVADILLAIVDPRVSYD